jgi:hypothetical protein
MAEEIVPVLRLMELSGEIMSGYFFEDSACSSIVQAFVFCATG